MTAVGPGGLADIDCGTVDAAARNLAKSGSDLQTEWQAANATIATEEAGIGGRNDRLAAAFRGVYDATAQQARAAGAELPGKYADLGAAAQASVQDYRTGDHQAAVCFPA